MWFTKFSVLTVGVLMTLCYTHPTASLSLLVPGEVQLSAAATVAATPAGAILARRRAVDGSASGASPKVKVKAKGNAVGQCGPWRLPRRQCEEVMGFVSAVTVLLTALAGWITVAARRK